MGFGFIPRRIPQEGASMHPTRCVCLQGVCFISLIHSVQFRYLCANISNEILRQHILSQTISHSQICIASSVRVTCVPLVPGPGSSFPDSHPPLQHQQHRYAMRKRNALGHLCPGECDFETCHSRHHCCPCVRRNGETKIRKSLPLHFW